MIYLILFTILNGDCAERNKGRKEAGELRLTKATTKISVWQTNAALDGGCDLINDRGVMGPSTDT